MVVPKKEPIEKKLIQIPSCTNVDIRHCDNKTTKILNYITTVCFIIIATRMYIYMLFTVALVSAELSRGKPAIEST